MDREEIMLYLPHRGNMQLLDEAYLDSETECHAFYTIPQEPFYCDGHFPGNPIVPGVILCEIMAQGSFPFMMEVLDRNMLVYRGLDGVKFRAEVHPGDRCEIRCSLIEKKGSLCRSQARLFVDGKLCTQATVTLAATPKHA